MSDLNLASIQADLGVSLERFSQKREIIQTKTEEADLRKKQLGINQMRKKFDDLAEKIKKKGGEAYK